jgi:hypothetical protein
MQMQTNRGGRGDVAMLCNRAIDLVDIRVWSWGFKTSSLEIRETETVAGFAGLLKDLDLAVPKPMRPSLFVHPRRRQTKAQAKGAGRTAKQRPGEGSGARVRGSETSFETMEAFHRGSLCWLPCRPLLSNR